MSKRREFTRSVAAEIMRRVERPTGFQCEGEGCGLIVARGEIHHKDMDAMQVDKRRKLTAEDGVFLCCPCHDGETAKQAPILAKVKRQEAAHLRIKTAPSRKLQSAPFPKSERKPKRVTKPYGLRWCPITGERLQ
jgi:hypothetical protein